MSIPNRQRQRRLSIFLTEEELAVLEAKKDEADLSKSQFIRNMIMFGFAHERTVFSSEDTRALLYELNRIGNNLNQIAFLANTSKIIEKSDFSALYNNYTELLSCYFNFITGNLDRCMKLISPKHQLPKRG